MRIAWRDMSSEQRKEHLIELRRVAKLTPEQRIEEKRLKALERAKAWHAKQQSPEYKEKKRRYAREFYQKRAKILRELGIMKPKLED